GVRRRRRAADIDGQQAAATADRLHGGAERAFAERLHHAGARELDGAAGLFRSVAAAERQVQVERPGFRLGERQRRATAAAADRLHEHRVGVAAGAADVPGVGRRDVAARVALPAAAAAHGLEREIESGCDLAEVEIEIEQAAAATDRLQRVPDAVVGHHDHVAGAGDADAARHRVLRVLGAQRKVDACLFREVGGTGEAEAQAAAAAVHRLRDDRLRVLAEQHDVARVHDGHLAALPALAGRAAEAVEQRRRDRELGARGLRQRIRLEARLRQAERQRCADGERRVPAAAPDRLRDDGVRGDAVRHDRPVVRHADAAGIVTVAAETADAEDRRDPGGGGQAREVDVRDEVHLAVAAPASDRLREDAVRAVAQRFDQPGVAHGHVAADTAAAAGAADAEAETEALRARGDARREFRRAVAAAAADRLREDAVRARALRRDDPAGLVRDVHVAAGASRAARAAEREAELRAAALVLERGLRFEVAVAAAAPDRLRHDAGRVLAGRRNAAARQGRESAG